jgi:hypothetical protein
MRLLILFYCLKIHCCRFHNTSSFDPPSPVVVDQIGVAFPSAVNLYSWKIITFYPFYDGCPIAAGIGYDLLHPQQSVRWFFHL